jgi:hypothetical protein
LKPAASCLTSPKRPKVSLSLHNCACLKSQCKGLSSLLFHKKSYIHLPLTLILPNRKHHRCAGLARSPASHRIPPRLLLSLAPAGSRSRRLFASRPEPHYLETSISTPRVLSHAAWTLTVVTQSVSVSIWSTRLTTILLSSVGGQLRKGSSPCQQAPFWDSKDSLRDDERPQTLLQHTASSEKAKKPLNIW